MQTPDESLTYHPHLKRHQEVRQIPANVPIRVSADANPVAISDLMLGGASAIQSHAPANEDDAVVVEITGPDGSKVLVRMFCGIHAAAGRT